MLRSRRSVFRKHTRVAKDLKADETNGAAQRLHIMVVRVSAPKGDTGRVVDSPRPKPTKLTTRCCTTYMYQMQTCFSALGPLGG